MKAWFNHIIHMLDPYREDIEFLLYVGVPGGILILLLNQFMEFSKLF